MPRYVNPPVTAGLAPGRKTVLIFSDLKEDLKDSSVRDIGIDPDGRL